jgi:hypothetical protein
MVSCNWLAYEKIQPTEIMSRRRGIVPVNRLSLRKRVLNQTKSQSGKISLSTEFCKEEMKFVEVTSSFQMKSFH